MSFEATKWAWDRIRELPNLPATRRLVLLALADRHNGLTGQCNPSLDLLVADTGMNRHTIPSAIRDLESDQLLTVKRKHGAGSEYTLVGFQTSAENSTSAEKRTSEEIRTATSAEKRTTPVRKSALEPRKNQEENLETTTQQRAREMDDKQPGPQTRSAEGTDKGESPKTRTRAKNPKKPIADNWMPSDRCMDLIARAGIPKEFAESQIGEFVLYWRENGESRPGWDSTFLNRCKTQWEWQQNKKPPVPRQQQPGASSTSGVNYGGRPQPGQSTPIIDDFDAKYGHLPGIKGH